MSPTRLIPRLAAGLVVLATVAACSSSGGASQSAAAPSVAAPSAPAASEAGALTYEDLTVGFIQTGSEGGWRAANTASFKDTAEELGINLKFYDAQNKMENQLSAFRNFIADDEVDVIILAALEAAGWDAVLQEAKDAGKTVVLEDRRIDAPEDLYATYIGSDFTLEGRKAADEMCELLGDSANKNVVELVGNVGSSAAIDRGKGFRENMAEPAASRSPMSTQTGELERDRRARRSWQAFLKKSTDIDGRLRPERRDGPRRRPGARGGRAQAGRGRQDHHRRRHQGRLRGDDRRQDQRGRRVQPAARTAGLRGGAQGGQRRDAPEVGALERERLLPGRRGARSCRTRKY